MSKYIEKFADQTERDFALAQVESFCKAYDLDWEYDPISSKLSIFSMDEDEIQESWLDWCRNNPIEVLHV
jgi:hypothetical protein